MNRREFVRALGWCAAAVVAGEPIAKAWAAALARARRRRMIEKQIAYQAMKSMEVFMRQHMKELENGVHADDYIIFANEKPSEPSAWQGGYEYSHRSVMVASRRSIDKMRLKDL